MAKPPAKHPPKPKRGTKLEVEALGVDYSRYSSHSQRDVSIEQQQQWNMEIAREYGIKIVEHYQDRAISGRTDKRKDFQRMMREIPKLGIQYVIAWKSNRMGRNMLEALINEAKLQDMGVRVLYVEEDFDDTAAGRFAARSMMNVNQFYSENMAEDIRRGLMDNAEKCMVNGSLPFGYRRSADGYYEVDPEKAEIVREIFKRFLNEESFADIGRDLNARGIRTKRGNPWNKNSFHRLLSNETYIGVYSYSGIRREGGVPAIITREVFDAAQVRLKTKPNPMGRHRMNSDYLLTGKLFCGHCGSPMVGISGTSKTGEKHYYYSCQKHRLEKSCNKKNVRRDYIESRVIAKIKGSLMDHHVIEWLVDGYEEFVKKVRSESLLVTYEQDLVEVNKALKNIMRAIEQGIFTETTKDRLQELEQERRTLEGNIAAEKALLVDTPKEQVQFWLESWRQGDIDDPKTAERMIDTFVKAVYLYDTDGGLRGTIVCNYTGKDSTLELSLPDLEELADTASPECSYKLPSSPPIRKPPSRVVFLLVKVNIGNRTSQMRRVFKLANFLKLSCYLKLSFLAVKLYNKQRKEAWAVNDRKALQDLRAGSQEALIWIMNKYGGYVSTIVWNIIGPAMSVCDAEEVVSDVFLALWNRSSAIRTNSIKSYLAGIARNKAKMKLREAGHTLALDCNIMEFEVSNPEDAYEKKELELLVKKAINQLKEPDCEILLRYFYYYQTMDTISTEMGINLSTVKTKIRRGKDSIRSNLLSRFNKGGSL